MLSMLPKVAEIISSGAETEIKSNVRMFCFFNLNHYIIVCMLYLMFFLFNLPRGKK